jgi:hypothetical protein
MSRTLGAFLVVASLACVPGARAGGTNVKCAMNEDRVWVYESVVDFNVAAKLKCGDPVEITGRVKGYVKIQTQAGVEGYVADSAFPKSALPPEPVEAPHDVQSASVAALAHHSTPPSINSTEPKPVATVASSAPVSASPAPAAVTRPQPPTVAAQPAPQPVLVASAAPVARPQPPTVAPAPKPQPVAVASAPPATAPAAPSAPTVTASPAPASQPAEVEITLSTAPSPAPEPKPAPAASQPAPAPAAAPYVSNASTTVAPATTSAPSVQPVSNSVARPTKPAANPDEDEDTEVKALENETAGCTHFFSAYGLSPNQYKWLAQNRKKAFPSVCPAPTPSMVDFVVIFTHDVAFYNVTMPTAVHVDHNGFSDWTPMSTVDTALMTQSEANNSHHEYVWVFHTSRGAFDPARFSSKRKPLFSKGETNVLGSHGGYKTVMDALTYIESNGTDR